MKTDRNMLAEHGTRLLELRPSSVVQAADADLRRFARNTERGQGNTIGHHLQDGYEPYAFHRKHVRKAITPAELLTLAINDPEPGLVSGKYNTRLLYGDLCLLRAALDHASRGSGESGMASGLP